MIKMQQQIDDKLDDGPESIPNGPDAPIFLPKPSTVFFLFCFLTGINIIIYCRFFYLKIEI